MITKKMITELAKRGLRHNKCKVCEEDFIYTVKRGRAPGICTEAKCISENRRRMRKPKPRVVRKHTCEGDDCENEIEQHGKGRTLKWCESCRKKVRAKQNATYREQNFVPLERDQGTCVDCEKALGVKAGRGKIALRCEDCQHKNKNERARISAKKCYEPVVRSYCCSVCAENKEQTGRGKLRKTCPTCLTISPAAIKKAVKIRKKRNDANIEGNEAQDAMLAKEAKKLFDKLQKEEDEDKALWAGILDSMDD